TRRRTAVERRSSEFNSSGQGRHGISSVESGSSVKQHNIASRTSYASEHGANDISRLLCTLYLEVSQTTGAKAELLWADGERMYLARTPLSHQSRAREGDLIESVLTVDSQSMRTPQPT